MRKIFDLIGGFFLDIIETAVVALSIFLIVYLFLMQPHQVSGESMVPNFHDKEYLLTDKISYKQRFPQRGEVIVFHAPPRADCPQGTGCDFVKRVIGVPGDIIEVKEGFIFLNGQKLEESYIPDDVSTHPGAYTSSGPVRMGDNEYFVAGDNRNHSSDSRIWGPIKLEDIVGRVFFRYWPPDRVGKIEHVTF